MNMLTITSINPTFTGPYYLDCSRCKTEKSVTDLSVVVERPWKYYCQHCIILEIMDAEKEGLAINYV